MRPETTYQTIDLALIDEPAHQLREAIDPGQLTELADSMAAEGLHQPIGVRGPDPRGRYDVVWGHRRLLAARLLQWRDISARVFPPGYDPLLAAVSENLQRTDLTPVEEAHAIEQMLSRGHSHASVARLFRRSPAWVDARLRLLALPQDLRDAVHARRVALGVADALGQIDHDGYRAELIAEAERTGASIATVNVWAAHYAADRDRLIQNRATVQEFIESRSKYVVYYPCDACGVATDYADTRAMRFCLRCAGELQAALTAARQPDAQRSATNATPA